MSLLYNEHAPGRPAGRRGRREREAGQAQPGQGRLQPPVVPAVHLRPRRDHGPAPVHDHADRPGRLGPDLAAPRGRPAADPRAPAAPGGPHAHALARRAAAPVPVAAEAEHVQQRGRRPRRARAGVPAVAAVHRLRHARPGVPVQLRQHPPVPDRPGPLRAPEVPRPQRRREGDPPGRPGPVPARLRGGAPGRVPLRAVGAPGSAGARRPSSPS